MDDRISNDRTVINPYRKKTGAKETSKNNNESFEFLAQMGGQSQLRNGSIKNAKKKGTQNKHRRQNANVAQSFENQLRNSDGSTAFVPHLHCKICIAYHKGKNPPKRAHDKRCFRNTKMRGLLNASSTNTSTNTSKVNKFYAERQKNNSTLYLPNRDKVDYTAEESKKLKQSILKKRVLVN